MPSIAGLPSGKVLIAAACLRGEVIEVDGANGRVRK
jgi:hypothetical protein